MARPVSQTASHDDKAEPAQSTLVGDEATQDGIAIAAHAEGQLDDKDAAGLQEQLATNKQGGWTPVTDEEKRLNRRLNLKLDLVVSGLSFSLVYIRP